MNIEKNNLELGYVSLNDCAPLVIAKQKGFFARHELDVELSREPSWANIRDKVAIGALDGAQMLAAMPVATTLGIGTWKKPTVTALSLGLNGNAVTVSNSLYQDLSAMDASELQSPASSAQLLKKLIEQRNREGKPQLCFAHVFNVSMHNYLLRYWLASAGIDPDKDLRLIVIPPAQMVENLEAGTIDGFCVGEPWNTVAVNRGAGHVLLTGYEIWNNAPEKVLGVNQEWAEQYPQTHMALIRAVVEAATWCDKDENREELADILVSGGFVDLEPAWLKKSLHGRLKSVAEYAGNNEGDFNVFSRYCANFPWRSHAIWIMTQMYRWGQLATPLNLRAEVEQIYRPDIYRAAMAGMDMVLPETDYKVEGLHAGTWQFNGTGGTVDMGSDLFLDGQLFDPADPVAYLQAQDEHFTRQALDELFGCKA